MRKPDFSKVRKYSNRCLFAFTLVFLPILSSCDRIKNLVGQTESEHVQQLEALSARLNELESVVQQQAPVLQQIRENVTPVEISPQWENHLEQLENQVASSDKWPKDAVEAGKFFEQTSDLVTGLPVWVEANYLPRLSLIRWAAMAFNSLHNAQDDRQSLDQLEQLVDEMRELADFSPEGGSVDLIWRLRENAEEIENKVTTRRVREAIVQANKYVDQKEDIPVDTSEIARLYEFLELYEEDNEYADVIDVDLPALRKKLYEKIVLSQAEDQVASLRVQWKNVKAMVKDQPQAAVYEVAARMLLQQVTSTQATLVLEGIETPVYNELEKELRAAVETIDSQLEKRQAGAIRDYQRWALEEIGAFETAFEEIKKKADEEGSWWRQDNGGWIDYYKEVQDAMIKHILPINVALLDLPVHERYIQAFQTGWKKLDGRKDQTSVAEASATTRKKPLRDFLKD